MVKWTVAPGPASRELAFNVAEKLEADIVEVESKTFPDGECKITVKGSVSNRKVALIQSTHPPTDQHILQLLFAAHKLSKEGGQVCAVIPYLAYARQDREFLKGEAVSLEVLASMLNSTGVHRIVTVDVHSIRGLGYFQMPTSNLSAIPLVAEYFKSRFDTRNALSVSPDLGGSKRAERFAELLGIEFEVLRKSRDRQTGEISTSRFSRSAEGKSIIIVDDIVSTGESMCNAATLLRKYGAKSIYAACIHPLLLGDAERKIKDSGVEELIGTNTVPSPVSKVDVAPLLASHLKSL